MALVLDHGLFCAAFSLRHIHQIIDDPVFQPHDHIQVPKTDIRIDQQHLLSQFCKTCSYVCACCGLSNTAFP